MYVIDVSGEAMNGISCGRHNSCIVQQGDHKGSFLLYFAVVALLLLMAVVLGE